MGAEESPPAGHYTECSFKATRERTHIQTHKLHLKPDVVNRSRFAPRPGTKAAAMKQVPTNRVKERSKVLMEVAEKISKEQKQDLMHVAICTVLSSSGYYTFVGNDKEGWPHFEQLLPLPEFGLIEQENFIKDHILLYFQQQGFIN